MAIKIKLMVTMMAVSDNGDNDSDKNDRDTGGGNKPAATLCFGSKMRKSQLATTLDAPKSER